MIRALAPSGSEKARSTLRMLLTRAIEVTLGHRSAAGVKPQHRVTLPLIRHKGGGAKLRSTNATIAQSEEDEDLYRYKRSLR